MMNERRKRRRAQRRLSRDVMQNTLVLKGWLPVVCDGNYGLVHYAEHLLVLREPVKVPEASRPSAYSPLKLRTAWRYTSTRTGFAAHKLVECSWNDMQAQWMRGLRAVVIQRGWL